MELGLMLKSFGTIAALVSTRLTDLLLAGCSGPPSQLRFQSCSMQEWMNEFLLQKKVENSGYFLNRKSKNTDWKSSKNVTELVQTRNIRAKGAICSPIPYRYKGWEYRWDSDPEPHIFASGMSCAGHANSMDAVIRRRSWVGHLGLQHSILVKSTDFQARWPVFES